jgi:hypothetical protein
MDRLPRFEARYGPPAGNRLEVRILSVSRTADYLPARKRGMYLCGVPRAREPSAAARRLVQELADRGLVAGYRAIEDWAARGLAPAPARRPLGRGRGTASEYPPGAVDQYAAVASVMRRGRPWQVSVLKLLVRGYLPARENLVRQAFADLLAPPAAGPGEDALDRAEQVAAQAAATRAVRPILRGFERNLRRSRQVLEPGTEIAAAATGVMATLALILAGEPEWSADALTEMMAAYGIPVEQMTSDDRAGLSRFASAFSAAVMSGAALARVAAETPLHRIQAAVPRGREAAREALAGLSAAFPRPGEDVDDVLTAISALMLIRTEDLGGDEAVAELVSQALSGQLAG